MPVNPDAVSEKGTPVRRAWTSKDALLYALGVGAGVDDLAFTTENTRDEPQRVLPTMAVVVGMGGVPDEKIGTFNPAMLPHGAQKIELFEEIPPEGEIETTGMIGAIWDKGKGVSIDLVVSMWVDGRQRRFQTTNQNGQVPVDQGVMGFE